MKALLEDPNRQVASIVAVGSFNPAIFHPLWFSANELIPKEEADAADIKLIEKRIAVFAIGKMQVQVDSDRFSLTTPEPAQFPILRDLANGALTILEHTPLKAIGFNYICNFAMKSKESWHAVGDALVPKEKWNGVLISPGMLKVVVEGKRADCSADHIQIRVEPAERDCVAIAINQHYRLATDDPSNVRECHRGAERALADDWADFLKYAAVTASQLIV